LPGGCDYRGAGKGNLWPGYRNRCTSEREDKMMTKKRSLPGVFTISLKRPHKYILVPLLLGSLGQSMSGAAGAPSPRKLQITLVYTTAETSTSAAVVWNTNAASDSLLQYSTSHPIPPSAPIVYRASPVTYHEIPLTALTPGTLYHFKVTSCAKRECRTAYGSFDTFPSCPDTVPPVSGSWEKVFSPNVSERPSFKNELLGIAAVSDNDVWAVGWAQDPDGPPYVKRTLIEHFDGTSWSIVPSSNPPNDYLSELHSVSGASANDVWAVGFTHDGTFPTRTLIQHWDGTEWRIVPSPSPEDQLNALYGVAALSANDAWAVGYRSGSRTEGPIDTLILHWDGVSWSQVASPNIFGAANQLFGITAISRNDIWAVGYAGGAPLSMHWNGNAWSIVPIRGDPGSRSDYLVAVSGAASNDVWAVGIGRGFFNNRAFATIRHWDGVHWTQKVCRAASSSNPPDDYEGGGPDAYFTGVSAAASNDVWAVGVSGSGPMILHWDGSAWTRVTHPRAFPNSATVNAVTTSSDGRAWSAGVEIEITSFDSVTRRTRVARYTP
jgi:hypothetical protein